jgi:ADP-dependent NAD(P)H-hydrate dehydratase
MRSQADPQDLDARSLRAWALPPLSEDADKEARGRVLVIAGSREIPGAAVLAATAALRVGAGKLAIATGESVATALAFAMPEARVIALPETPTGGFRVEGVGRLESSLRGARAVLVGPGMTDTAACQDFVRALLPLARGCPVVLDASAMDAAMAGPFAEPVLLTPHAGEMAHLTGGDKASILADPLGAALDAARRWSAVVAVKGPTTIIATPDGRSWRHTGGNCGLATSGSGDTLAGAIAGLCARGASLEQACAWGVVLHAQAGERLAAKLGAVGYLAREIPGAMLEAMNAVTA